MVNLMINEIVHIAERFSDHGETSHGGNGSSSLMSSMPYSPNGNLCLRHHLVKENGVVVTERVVEKCSTCFQNGAASLLVSFWRGVRAFSFAWRADFKFERRAIRCGARRASFSAVNSFRVVGFVDFGGKDAHGQKRASRKWLQNGVKRGKSQSVGGAIHRTKDRGCISIRPARSIYVCPHPEANWMRTDGTVGRSDVYPCLLLHPQEMDRTPAIRATVCAAPTCHWTTAADSISSMTDTR